MSPSIQDPVIIIVLWVKCEGGMQREKQTCEHSTGPTRQFKTVSYAFFKFLYHLGTISITNEKFSLHQHKSDPLTQGQQKYFLWGDNSIQKSFGWHWFQCILWGGVKTWERLQKNKSHVKMNIMQECIET